MAYHFYIQKYPQGNQTFQKVDVEKTYNCKYKAFQNLFFDGNVKNTYSESYAEQSGNRLYVPEKEDLTFEAYDCTLELLFDKQTCQDDLRRFYEDIRGQRLEWSDDFRNLHISLLNTEAPSVTQEVLYGNRPYQLISIKFQNYLGKVFKQSQIK